MNRKGDRTVPSWACQTLRDVIYNIYCVYIYFYFYLQEEEEEEAGESPEED